MRPTHAVRFLALLLGVAACSHRQSTASEEVPPPAAMPRPAVTAEDIERHRVDSSAEGPVRDGDLGRARFQRRDRRQDQAAWSLSGC